jgi:Ran GTPase-activating protein (RanGAP) involved in mRNA processing and transport
MNGGPAIMSNTLPTALAKLRLHTLQLTCKIGDAGTRQLCDALCEMGAASCLNWLMLHKNEIGDDGAKALAQLLRADVPLEILDVGINHFAAAAADALAASMSVNRKLRILLVHCNLRFSDAARATVVLGLASNTVLEELAIHEHRGAVDEVCVAVASLLEVNRTLHRLHLGDSEFGDAAVISLSAVLSKPACALRSINFETNKLTDTAAAALADALSSNPHSNLCDLNLNENGITVEGAVLLVKAFGAMLHSHEIKLSLQANRLSEACKEALMSAWSARPAPNGPGKNQGKNVLLL